VGPMKVEVPVVATDLAALAATEAKSTGRPCRLQDATALEALLGLIAAGRTMTSAAEGSGFSEGVVRRWLKLGAREDAGVVYRQFRSAVEAVQAAPVSPDGTPAPGTTNPPRTIAVPSVASAGRTKAIRHADIDALEQRVITLQDRMFLPGVKGAGAEQAHRAFLRAQAELDTALAALAPQVETLEQREVRFRAWLTRTRRGMWNESAYELARIRQFRQVQGFI
jgi:hypothetical protein